VRIAVFNEHWETYGGGEQFAGGIAQALSLHHDVDVLTHGELDPVLLESRLGLDLSRTRERVVSKREFEFIRDTAEYDLLVNCSFMSHMPNGARHGLYVVHFPSRRGGMSGRARARALRTAVRRSRLEEIVIHDAAGLHPLEADGRSRWTERKAQIELFVPAGEEVALELSLSSRHWPIGSRPQVTVTLDAEPLFDAEIDRLEPVTVTAPVKGRGRYDSIVLTIESDFFVPSEEFGTADPRELGILIQDLSVGSRRLAISKRWRRARAFEARPLGYLQTYDVIASNSSYTQRWVREWWARESEILYPPVKLRERAEKDRIILGVGRFFGSHVGHSKKQLELVRAFRSLCREGVGDWTLHLAGGCSEEGRGYLDEVRRASTGLPVRFHVNATGADLRQLFARASIFWHATGLRENAERNPDRLEHFGISIVEAMSAGAVPVVFGKGGPAEIVHHGREGVHFSSKRELVDRTLTLIRDPKLLQAMSTAAQHRADDFGFEEFSKRIEALVQRVVLPVNR